MKVYCMLLLCVLLTGCGSDQCYGLLDKDNVKKKDVKYEVKVSNIVWSVLGAETIVAPIWLVGYRLHCPVEEK